MTATVPDDASRVIAALRGEQASVDAAEVRKLRLAVAWASMHSSDSLVGPVAGWTEQPVVVAGRGHLRWRSSRCPSWRSRSG